MTSDENWPNWRYYPGPAEHLHAVGALSSAYNSFERINSDLFLHHLNRRKFPRAFVESYYFGLDESRRIKALKDVFEKFEKTKNVKSRIDNLCQFFNWSWGVRNIVLHAEVPPRFLVEKTELNLAKRAGRRSSSLTYLTLKLPEIRLLADQVALGRQQAAEIDLYLRYRDTQPSRRSLALRAAGPLKLPKPLLIPASLPGSSNSHVDQISAYLQKLSKMKKGA